MVWGDVGFIMLVLFGLWGHGERNVVSWCLAWQSLICDRGVTQITIIKNSTYFSAVSQRPNVDDSTNAMLCSQIPLMDTFEVS